MAPKLEINYVKEFKLCDKDHVLILKGISILAIMVAYFCMTYMQMSGWKFVAYAAATVFVLCSGFGVSESYLKKRGLFHYWENKVMKVWLPSLLVLTIFGFIEKGIGIYWITQYPVGLKGEFLYVIFGGYAAFWIMAQFGEKKPVRIIGVFVIALLAFVFVPGKMWIRTCMLAFPVGVMFSQMGWKRKIREFTWKGTMLLLLACAAVAGGAWVGATMMENIHIRAVLWNIAFIATGAFLCFFTYFTQKASIYGIFAPLGFISYGLYLLYDDIFAMLSIPLQWRKAVIVIVVLLVSATALSWVRELAINWNRNMRKRSKTHLKGSMW